MYKSYPSISESAISNGDDLFKTSPKLSITLDGQSNTSSASSSASNNLQNDSTTTGAPVTRTVHRTAVARTAADRVFETEADDHVDADSLRRIQNRQNRFLSSIKAFNGEAVERYAQNKWKDVAPLRSIMQNHNNDRSNVAATPYQPGFCAELEEELFQKLDRLLKPKQANESLGIRWSRTRRRLEPTSEAVEIFGRASAQSMVTAAHQIDLSGIVWGSQWTDGIIRGVDCGGFIEQHILLLCLPSERFYRSEAQHIMEIIRSLECMDVLEKAIIHWGWEDDYYFLINPPKSEELVKQGAGGATAAAANFHMSKNELRFLGSTRSRERTRFLHCVLFCTRVYTCEVYFKRNSRSAQLERKVRECLDIMNDLVHSKYPDLARSVQLDASHAANQLESATGAAASEPGETAEDVPDSSAATSSTAADRADPTESKKRALDHVNGALLGVDEDDTEEEDDFVVNKSSRSFRRNINYAEEDDEEYVYIEDEEEDEDSGGDGRMINLFGDDPSHTRRGRHRHRHSRSNYSDTPTASGSRKRTRSRFKQEDESACSLPDDDTREKTMGRFERSSHGIVSIDASSSAQPTGYESSSLSCEGFETSRDSLVKSQPKRPVQLVCPETGKVVATFASTDVINQALALPKGSILANALSGKLSTWRGYQWKYVDLSEPDKLVSVLKLNGRLDDVIDDLNSRGGKKRSKRRHTKSKKQPGITVVNDDGTPITNVDKQVASDGEESPELCEDEPQQSDPALGQHSDGLDKASVVSRSKAGKIVPIEPYTRDGTAEDGVEPFETVRRLLQPCDEGAYVPASSDAANTFGATLAKSLVLARRHVSDSSAVYDAEWRNGVIGGVACGFVPKAMLLLCLNEKEFAKHEVFRVGTLAKIISDLGVSAMIRNAISEWKIEGNYRNLKSSTTTFSYDENLAECQRCELFVARAYRALKALRRGTITVSLMTKVRSCLAIMESNMRPRAQSPSFSESVSVHDTPAPIPLAPASKRGKAKGGSLPLIKRKVNSLCVKQLPATSRSSSPPPPKRKKRRRKGGRGSFGSVEMVCLKTNKVIKVFRSANAACIATAGTAGHSLLYRCLRNELKEWKGYGWRYTFPDYDPKVVTPKSAGGGA